MPRLFVAVDLPAYAIEKLTRIQPPPMTGLRLIIPGQMHLTLHFIGEAEIEPIAAALESVAAPVFQLTIEGVGKFRSAGGGATLWAGVQESVELLSLHAAVGTALTGAGFKPETRRYAPHITLARCKPDTPGRAIARFLAQHKALSLPDSPIVKFGLYSSTLIASNVVYRQEQSFPLRLNQA